MWLEMSEEWDIRLIRDGGECYKEVELMARWRMRMRSEEDARGRECVKNGL